jgi:hypothetical protein
MENQLSTLSYAEYATTLERLRSEVDAAWMGSPCGCVDGVNVVPMCDDCAALQRVEEQLAKLAAQAREGAAKC